MQLQGETSPDDLAFCLSFSCYFSDNTSIALAAAKVICELSDVHEEDFEFSPDRDEQVSAKQIDDFEFIFPLLDDAGQENNNSASAVSIQLQKSSVDEKESCFSSTETDEYECNYKPSRILCMWSVFAKRKKRSSKIIDASKERRKVTAGKLKASPSFHEVFYVQKRAEQKGDKMKSFLPYKQDLLGFFVNINRKKLLF